MKEKHGIFDYSGSTYFSTSQVLPSGLTFYLQLADTS